MIRRRSLLHARPTLALVALAIAAVALPQPVAAYHFFYVANGSTQLPVAWRNLPVSFIVDNTPASFQTTVQSAFDVWNNVPTAVQIFGSKTVSGSDLNDTNYQTTGGWGHLNGDGKHEVVCDSDGKVMTKLGKSPTTTLGTGPSLRQVVGGQGAITDAFFVLNCSIAESTDFNYLATMVHELGHDIGLAHSSAYLPDAERLEPLASADTPTMDPFSVPGNDSALASLEADDIAGVSELYPDTGFAAAYGTISGRVSRCNTDEPVQGVNVRAVSTGDSKKQITRYSGFDGNANGDYAMRVPVGTYHLIIEVMSREVARMAMLTTVDKDFATEYKSVQSDEDNCLEELPDQPLNIAAASADEGLGQGGIGDGPTIANQNFKTNPVELAFVIDDTGSMGEEIAAVRQALTNEITRLQASGKPFPTTAILTFKDDVTIHKISRDPAALQPVVNGLTADGGDDCPEFSNAALLSAGRLLRNGGKAMLFTDADSHPDGPDAAAVASFYTSKSLRMSVLLSGTCSGALDPPAGGVRDASRMDPATSQNPGWRGRPERAQDRFPLPPPLGEEDAIKTYSTLTTATGGIFAAVPGINSSDPAEETRYINIGTNIAVSATLPTVGLVVPGDGPRGTSIDVDITGSNTNFQSSSALSFAGSGITVNFRLVRSATSMTANITIDPSAATGFRDVTVTTNLGGGSVETAVGVGAFNVVQAPTMPTILSASPNSSGRGTTLDVTISGASTAFTAASVPIFCLSDFCADVSDHDPKIVVNSKTVNGPRSMRVNITIAADAEISYRSLSVITGAEVAMEIVPGPFLVTAPPPSIPTLTSITPSSALPGQTLSVSVVGVNTAFVNGASVLSFSGTGITVNSTTVNSPTTATASITIAAGAAPGFRDVFVVTDGASATLLNGFNVLGTAPTAEPPTGLYAASITGNVLTLRWTPPAGGLAPTDYVLEGGISPGQVLASIPTGSTYPIFTVTAPAGVFYVRIHTMSGASRSVASNEIRVWVANQSAPPSAPASFTGVRNGSTIGLSWRNTFAGGAPATLVLDVTGSVNTSIPLGLTDSFSFAGVPNGTYTLSLRATNAAGASASTSTVSLTFPGACAGPPFPPSNFIAYRIGRTLFVLWEPPASGAAPTDYILNVTGSFVGSFPTPTRALSGTVGAGSYTFSVLARNACGTSVATPVQTVVVP